MKPEQEYEYEYELKRLNPRRSKFGDSQDSRVSLQNLKNDKTFTLWLSLFPLKTCNEISFNAFLINLWKFTSVILKTFP